MKRRRNYIKRRNIAQNFDDDDDMLKICSGQIAFPLLSNLFTSSPTFINMQSTFFRSPSMIFKEELNRLQIENKKVYCVLVLVVMFTIEELHMIFDINCEIERIEAYNKILRACEIPEKHFIGLFNQLLVLLLKQIIFLSSNMTNWKRLLHVISVPSFLILC